MFKSFWSFSFYFWILQFNFYSKYIDHRVWIYTSLLSWNHRFDDRQPCPNLWVSAKGQIRNGKRAKWTFLLIISAKKVYTSFIIISRHISTPVFTRKTPYGVKQQIIFKGEALAENTLKASAFGFSWVSTFWRGQNYILIIKMKIVFYFLKFLASNKLFNLTIYVWIAMFSNYFNVQFNDQKLHR